MVQVLLGIRVDYVGVWLLTEAVRKGSLLPITSQRD